MVESFFGSLKFVFIFILIFVKVYFINILLSSVLYVLEINRSKENLLILFFFDLWVNFFLVWFWILVLNKLKDNEEIGDLIEVLKIGGDFWIVSLRIDKEK